MKEFLETVDFIKSKVKDIPKIAIVLGSGLGSLSFDATEKIVIPYKDIPGFPISTVPGHFPYYKIYMFGIAGITINHSIRNPLIFLLDLTDQAILF